MMQKSLSSESSFYFITLSFSFVISPFPQIQIFLKRKKVDAKMQCQRK